MKQLVFFLLFISLSGTILAQSDSLKAFFMETCKALKNNDYDFDTDVISEYYNNNPLLKHIKYQTESVKLRIDKGYCLFYFKILGKEFNTTSYYQSGVYILKVPINGTVFDLNTNEGSSSIHVKCNKEVTLCHRGKEKKITDSKLWGDISSLKILHNNLISLHESLIGENFQGTMCPTASPSSEIRVAYNNVIKTLKEYRYESEDTWNNGKTKSISLKLQNGFFIFTFNDVGLYYSSKHDFGRDGIKTVKIPFYSAFFYQPYNEGKLNLSSTDDNVEISWRGQKEIIKNYGIRGTELNIKKLQQELELLLTIAIEEDFKGTLNSGSTVHKKTVTKKHIPQKKGKVTPQSYQRQRNRVPYGD